MQYEELSQRYQAAIKDLLPVLSEVGGQVLQAQITIQSEDPIPVSEEFVPGHEFPLLKVTMSSTANGIYEHTFLLDKSLSGLIFSWTAGEEVPEEPGEEHIDAVKQAAAQVLSQLQTTLEGKEHGFTAGDVQLVEISSEEELGVFSEGLVAVYRCTRGEDETEYTITHTMNGEMLPEEGEESSEEAKEAEEETVEASDVQAEAGEEAAVEEETAAETEEEAVPESAAEEAAPDTVEEEEGVSDDLAYEAEEDLMGTTDMAEFLGGGEGEESIVEVSRAEFEEFGEALPGDGKGRKIDLLLDVELDVSVELGRKVMVVEEILRLGKGSVVELNKLAGEPVDVLVNGKKLAEGEVVVVEDHFGVRLTHLLEPRERIKSLGK